MDAVADLMRDEMWMPRRVRERLRQDAERIQAEGVPSDAYFPVAGAAATAGGVGAVVVFGVVAVTSDDPETARLAAFLSISLVALSVGGVLVLVAGLWAWMFAPGYVRYLRLRRAHRDAIVLTARDFHLDPEGDYAGRLYDILTSDRGVTVRASGITFWDGAWEPGPLVVLPRERCQSFRVEPRAGGVGRAALVPRPTVVLTLTDPDEQIVFRVARSRTLHVTSLDDAGTERVVADIARVLGVPTW